MLKIGQTLKYYRQKQHLTQKQVAEKLHITPQTVSKWELDKSYPDLDQFVALSQLFHVNVKRLLEEPKPSLFDYLADSQNLWSAFDHHPIAGGERNDRR
ncbi:helix-turn-helix domain-containing protein [Enterococcus sp. CSURQ0835]|uniref:helix-turn-helix domain-containing protein n=1 Tax=Enterococcus sp. CSURQ0835 TaxID=2681394 RepID=UPI00135A4D2E|nr:helix-turn-helix transcriptional regulator [Enterococcus sp. CSURQ0835]